MAGTGSRRAYSGDLNDRATETLAFSPVCGFAMLTTASGATSACYSAAVNRRRPAGRAPGTVDGRLAFASLASCSSTWWIRPGSSR
jgi:hypothetical protein